MRKKFEKGKSIVAILLAVAMFFVGIPTGSQLVFAENTNYALDGEVTSSNTNASLAASYPAAQLTDGVPYYTREAGQTAVINYQENGLAYYEIELKEAAKLNQVRVYFNMAEPDKRPKDIAIDVKKTDETWVRAAELHNINYDESLVVTSNPRYLAFDFEAVESVALIRIKANKTRNNSSNFRLMEVEAYYDSTITTYTGTIKDANDNYNIPKLGEEETPETPGESGGEEQPNTLINYALNGIVTSTNTNESLAANYPATQLTDGVPYYTREAGQTAVINYQANGLAYYEIELTEAAKLNQVRVYFNQAEPEMRPKDIAVDVKKTDGTWVRAAEMQNINYDEALVVTDNPRYLAYNFEAVENVAAIRITANRARNNSSNFRLMEVEAYYDSTITTYTNYFIPEIESPTTPETQPEPEGPEEPTVTVSENYALNAKVTSSNTNASLAAGYPAAQATDGVTPYTREAGQTAVINYQENGLAYYQVALTKKAKINQVRVYFNMAEPEKRPKDIAVDVQTENGTWVRAAEMHNIDYDAALVEVNGHPGYLAFNFKALEATTIRVTANQARNSSTNFRIMEIEAYLDATITKYTGTKQDSNAHYNIPEVGKGTTAGSNAGGTTGGKNYALNGKVASSNTNASLEAGYPAAQATDGVTPYTRAANQTAVINYQANGLAYYEVELSQKAKINQVRVYFNMAEPEKRPKDIAVDIKKADGTWVRAAEMHNINYDKELVVTDNPRYLAFNFEALEATTIRVTANRTRNQSDATNFRIMEIEAYLDTTITTYTGVKQDANEAYNIPLLSAEAAIEEETDTTVKEEEQGGDDETVFENDENVNTTVTETKADHTQLIRTAGALIGTTLLVSILGIAAYLIWSRKQNKKTLEGKNE